MSVTSSVVICTNQKERKEQLLDCVRSVLSGVRAPDELVVVVDSDPALAGMLRTRLPDQAILLQSDKNGLSEARNVGLHAVSANVVAFIDDDAVADPHWLHQVTEAFSISAPVLAVGGSVIPHWETEQGWLPDELLWVVGCTYKGHTTVREPIRNPIGCNMAFRREALVAVGGFSSAFGKKGRALATAEETAVSLAIEQLFGPNRIWFLPEAAVFHFVPRERLTWRYLIGRCLAEGRSKARLSGMFPRTALRSERQYARHIVLKAILAYALLALRERDLRPMQSALALVTSLFVTGGAFIGTLLASRRLAWRNGLIAPKKDSAPSKGRTE